MLVGLIQDGVRHWCQCHGDSGAGATMGPGWCHLGFPSHSDKDSVSTGICRTGVLSAQSIWPPSGSGLGCPSVLDPRINTIDLVIKSREREKRLEVPQALVTKSYNCSALSSSYILPGCLCFHRLCRSSLIRHLSVDMSPVNL
jgi:hypothetical protein